MAYDLFVTEAAHEDLEEALGYIAGDLANPSAAANLLDQVEDCYEQLKDFPMLFECSTICGSAIWGIARSPSVIMCWSIIRSKRSSGYISCGSSTAAGITKN